MSINFFKRRYTRLENRITNMGGERFRNFTRTHLRGLEREMNNDLPNKVNEAREGFDTVNQISESESWTDEDVNHVISVIQPIKSYYQKYQTPLNINNSRYNQLTGPFTRQRNAWQRGNPTQRRNNDLGRKVIEEGKNFLEEARIDLQRRLWIQNPPMTQNPVMTENLPMTNPLMTETDYPPESSRSSRPRRVEHLRRRVNELPENISELEEYHNTLLNDIIEVYSLINEIYHPRQEILELNTLTHDFILKMQNHIPSEMMDNLKELFTASINEVGMTETDDISPDSSPSD